MINTIVLDIGNVLGKYRWEEYLQECGYDEELICKISKATVHNEVWKEWDRGVQRDEEVIAQCCEQDPSVVKEITSFFENNFEIVREFDYSVDFIQRLKANGYKVYLLSNYSRTNYKYAKENFKFIEFVDGGVISFEVAHIKPEPGIYQALINKYNINPEEAVFLDDMQANLDGANHFGFHTILVDSFDKALDDLRELGVRV